MGAVLGSTACEIRSPIEHFLESEGEKKIQSGYWSSSDRISLPFLFPFPSSNDRILHIMTPLLIDILTAVTSLFGFAIAAYIYHKKEALAPMVCPIGLDCHEVVHSDFSKFLGMRVEILGVIYYAFVFISNLFLFLYPVFNTPLVSLILWGLSIVAVLFSGYLVFLQLVVIRHLCSWCLISAFLSVVIAVLTTIGISQF